MNRPIRPCSLEAVCRKPPVTFLLGKISSAFSPIYGGYYNNGSLNNSSTNGNWWSSTANNSNNQYNLNYNNGSLNTNNNNKNNGNYVRCIRSS